MIKGDNGIFDVKYLNQTHYSKDNLKLFSETVCEELSLNNLKKFLIIHDYNPCETKDVIFNISKGKTSYEFTSITESAMKFHEKLFGTMYIKKLNKLPLMINHGDIDLIPVIKWRFMIGK